MASAEKLSLRARALSLLARREYTRKDLARRLAADDVDANALAALLDDFEQRGWLSERRYVDERMSARRRRFGSERIAHELAQHGVSDEELERARRELAAGELETAREVWRRKFGTLPQDARERARQLRFMRGRGFALEIVMRIIQKGDDDD
jgi:regulatory protein